MKKNVLLTAVVLGATLLAARADDASKVWDQHCAGCHGKEGKGDTKMGKILHVPDYSDSKVQASFTDEQAFNDIKNGVKKDGRTKMMAFEGKLTDDQIHELVKHIRTFKKSS
ncbi:MAG TPA: cytochrome c [Verrucomicrobiae bacterium]|nr:cytochrome c [Verrucomicrobiae bacterium]